MIIQVWGNVGSGKSSLIESVTRVHDALVYRIDDYRIMFSDGTDAGEEDAKLKFVDAIPLNAELAFIETLGVGRINELLYEKLKLSEVQMLIIILNVPINVCEDRLANRTWNIPFPKSLNDLDNLLLRTDKRLFYEKCYSKWQALENCTVKIFPNVSISENNEIITFLNSVIADE